MTPFTLYVGAVVHNDPLGPESLSAWLQGLETSHEAPPIFAALEFRKNDADTFAAHRHQIPAAFRAEFPNIPDDDLQAVTRGFMYEPGTLSAVFPAVEVLWLEEESMCPPAASNQVVEWSQDQARKRIEMGNPDHLGGFAKVMSRLSRRAGDASLHNGDYERDARWRAMIEAQPRAVGTWGIAILGKAHTRLTDPNSFVGQLLSNNIQCVVTDVCKVP